MRKLRIRKAESSVRVRVLSLAPCPESSLTGPQSETVHWRSQGGPVQFFSPTGLVLGSHSFSSSEQRMSLVTTLRSPHLAVHYKEARVVSIMVGQLSGTGHHPSMADSHLRPLRHLPLWPTGWIAAYLALLRPYSFCGLTQVTVHGAVKARRQHLPAAHDAELMALTTGA